MRKILKFKSYLFFREDLWGDFFYCKTLKFLPFISSILSEKKVILFSQRNLLEIYYVIKKYKLPFLNFFKKQLIDKQKIQKFYRILKSYQLKNFLKKAKLFNGSIEKNFLIFLERRLCIILVRAGFFVNTLQSRQYINHFGVLINNTFVDRFNFLISEGDLIELPGFKKKQYLDNFFFLNLKKRLDVFLNMTLKSSDFLDYFFIGYPSNYMEIDYDKGMIIIYKLPDLNKLFYPFSFSIKNIVSYYK